MSNKELNTTLLKEKYSGLFNDESTLIDLIGEVKFGYSEIKSFINADKVKKILEIGSGPGMLISELKNLFPNIEMTGLEPSIRGYNRYKKIFSNLKEKSTNVNNLNLVNNDIKNFQTKEKYDLIFSVNVLEHVEDWIVYIENSKKLLSPKGKCVILCPNYDFPYESHYIIPIILNKNFTKFLFKNKITKHDKKHNLKDHWENINFVSKRKIKKYLLKNNYNFYFDEKIKDRLIERVSNDLELKRKQGIAGKLAVMSKKIYLDKLIFDFLKVPFPYMKLIIKS